MKSSRLYKTELNKNFENGAIYAQDLEGHFWKKSLNDVYLYVSLV